MDRKLWQGSAVRIKDLQSRQALNGTVAVLGAYNSAKGRYAVEIPDGDKLLLKPANIELIKATPAQPSVAYPPEPEAADEDDDLALEENEDDEDGLQLEGNDDDEEPLLLEANGGASEDEDDNGLELEGNEDEDDDLLLEDNPGLPAADPVAEAALHARLEAAGLSADASRPLEIEDIFTPAAAAEERAYDLTGFGYGQASSSTAASGVSASVGKGGLEEALRALNPSGPPGTLGTGIDGMPVESSRFLIPSAKAALEQALQVYPRREGEDPRNYHMRVLQMLVAQSCNQETFTNAAAQIAEAYGIDTIAERMRQVGDDHFAAGAYVPAAYAYTAGIEAHSVESGDRAELMHNYVNRSAALLKLGQTERAVEDADQALALAECVYAPKTQRKALLRRATALFELGRLEAAKRDLDTLGSEDEGASRLRGKIQAGGGQPEDGSLV